MTSPSSTISHSFSGVLTLADGEVPAVVGFSNGSVSLAVAGDTIGNWPRKDVELRRVDDGFELMAEGDVVGFHPEESEAMSAFLDGREKEPIETPTQAETESPDETPTEDPAPTQLALVPPAPESELEPETPVFLTGDIGGEGNDPEQDMVPALEAGLDPDGDVPVGELIVEEPDEFFAAGLNGPTEAAPPPFRPTVLPEPEPPTDEPAPSADANAEPEATDLPSGPTAHIETPEPASAPVAESAPEEIASVDSSVAGDSDADDFDADDSDAEPSGEPEPATSTGKFRGMLARAVTRRPDTTTEAATVPADGSPGGSQGSRPALIENEEDDVPDPMSDAENLRQWGLVIAGGLVVLIVLAVATWGLVTMLSGDADTAEGTPANTPSTVSLPPPTSPPTTTPAPVTTVAPENRQAAAAFVSTWNGLAAQYAPHLTVAGDSLPLAAAPASTVHLVYDEAGTLTMTMAPRGDEIDRDILVAMGLAVAWADPGLGPDARRNVLGGLGVSVDQPAITDMGGELSRNGVSYSLTVVDGIIGFEVTGAAQAS